MAVSAGRLVKLAAANGLLLAALLGLLELTVRSLGWRPPGSYTNIRYENDPLAGPWALPSQVGFLQTACFLSRDIHVNRFGMRDRERTLEKQGKRLALVGDSKTQGLQVADHETVSRRLEELMGEAEALNFGVASAGTSVELLVYRKRVRLFRPDVVLLMFFAGNDVEDNLPALKARVDPAMASLSPYFLLDDAGRLNEAPKPGQWRRTSPVTVLLSHSTLGQWAYFGYQKFKRTMRPPPAYAAHEGRDPALYRQAWEITEQIILRFSREVARDDARFGLVLIPADSRSLGKTGRIDSDTAAAAARLAALARQGEFPFLDLSRAFRERVLERGPLELAHPCDEHWNARGHLEAATAIYRFLIERGWP